MEVCIHTNDKKYSMQNLSLQEVSTINIGNHKTVTNSDALGGQIWDENETVYWQLDTEYQHIPVKTQEKLIKSALLESSLLTPLKIHQKRRQTGDAHMRINWLGAKDEKLFADQPSTLAFNYGPGQSLGGDCTMNADFVWDITGKKYTAKEAYDLGLINSYDPNHPDNLIKTYDPVHTLKHELGGHGMGMRHITDINRSHDTVMFPFYNGLRSFGDYDIEYLLRLYGSAGTVDTIKKYILRLMKRI